MCRVYLFIFSFVKQLCNILQNIYINLPVVILIYVKHCPKNKKFKDKSINWKVGGKRVKVWGLGISAPRTATHTAEWQPEDVSVKCDHSDTKWWFWWTAAARERNEEWTFGAETSFLMNKTEN